MFASAKVLNSANAEANAIVVSFMILLFVLSTQNNKWAFYLIVPLKSSLVAMRGSELFDDGEHLVDMHEFHGVGSGEVAAQCRPDVVAGYIINQAFYEADHSEIVTR